MKRYLVIAILISSLPCFCSNLDNIDKAELECINNTSSTYEMLKCTETAQKAWENEINIYKRKLKNKLSKQDYELFLKSQKQWETYKQNEFILISNILDERQGTMHRNVAKSMKNDIVKQRALFLDEIYNIIIFE